MARSRRCIQAGDGPFLTPRTRRSAKAGHRCASSARQVELEPPSGKATAPRDGAAAASRFSRAEPGGGEVAGDAVDARGIGPVRRQVDLDHRIVETRHRRR